MNYLVIGAGNAGRPVARLLNNQNHKVIITDQNSYLILNKMCKVF